jgi:hypothetical protein
MSRRGLIDRLETLERAAGIAAPRIMRIEWADGSWWAELHRTKDGWRKVNGSDRVAIVARA